VNILGSVHIVSQNPKTPKDLINEKYAHKILIFFNSSIPLETRPSA
jgi:hypothetical protein